MIRYGYARTSTSDQIAGLEDQKRKLASAGVDQKHIFSEEASAVKERPQLERLLGLLRAGDTLVVTTLSRLARSTKHLLQIAEELNQKGCFLQILDFSLDTNTAQGRMVLTVLASVSEFERALMLERQAIGVAKAKAEGRYKGRPGLSEQTRARALELKASGATVAEIAGALGVGVSTVYKVLAQSKK